MDLQQEQDIIINAHKKLKEQNKLIKKQNQQIKKQQARQSVAMQQNQLQDIQQQLLGTPPKKGLLSSFKSKISNTLRRSLPSLEDEWPEMMDDFEQSSSSASKQTQTIQRSNPSSDSNPTHNDASQNPQGANRGTWQQHHNGLALCLRQGEHATTRILKFKQRFHGVSWW